LQASIKLRLQRGWVAASEFQIDDTIRSLDGDYGNIEAISIVDQSQTMYNLTVDEAHTFFVDGEWLVHNCPDDQIHLADAEGVVMILMNCDLHLATPQTRLEITVNSSLQKLSLVDINKL
jgi:hypothetical protein